MSEVFGKKWLQTGFFLKISLPKKTNSLSPKINAWKMEIVPVDMVLFFVGVVICVNFPGGFCCITYFW